MGNGRNIATLTARESQIVERIAWGASQKEVAADLGISRYTVDNILRKIYQKLHIGKINELSAWWFCTTFGISFDLSPRCKRWPPRWGWWGCSCWARCTRTGSSAGTGRNG